MKFLFLLLNWKPCPPDVQPVRFGFECPRRPGYMCKGLMINNVEVKRGEGVPCWDWDGDREKPTFSPSINCLAKDPETGEKFAGCGWHGHIVKGVANPPR